MSNISYLLKVQFLKDMNFIKDDGKVLGVKYDRRTKQYKLKVEELYKRLHPRPEDKKQTPPPIPRRPDIPPPLPVIEDKKQTPPPLPSWSIIPENETRAQKKRRLYKKNKKIKKQIQDALIERFSFLWFHHLHRFPDLYDNDIPVQFVQEFYKMDFIKVMEKLSIDEMKKLKLYVDHIETKFYVPTITLVGLVEHMTFHFKSNHMITVFYKNNKLESLKMFFDKGQVISRECLICFGEVKQSVGCTQCGERVCVECYINIYKSNAGISKCSFCNYEYGYIQTPAEIRFNEIELRRRFNLSIDSLNR
tara:strand:+ start:5508 stop:6425 length:918 start_codon:yes stop_codon:yes gene_type:complete